MYAYGRKEHKSYLQLYKIKEAGGYGTGSSDNTQKHLMCSRRAGYVGEHLHGLIITLHRGGSRVGG